MLKINHFSISPTIGELKSITNAGARCELELCNWSHRYSASFKIDPASVPTWLSVSLNDMLIAPQGSETLVIKNDHMLSTL
jgi:hypothetical protein